jgi:hypothetical protein
MPVAESCAVWLGGWESRQSGEPGHCVLRVHTGPGTVVGTEAG